MSTKTGPPLPKKVQKRKPCPRAGLFSLFHPFWPAGEAGLLCTGAHPPSSLHSAIDRRFRLAVIQAEGVACRIQQGTGSLKILRLPRAAHRRAAHSRLPRFCLKAQPQHLSCPAPFCATAAPEVHSRAPMKGPHAPGSESAAKPGTASSPGYAPHGLIKPRRTPGIRFPHSSASTGQAPPCFFLPLSRTRRLTRFPPAPAAPAQPGIREAHAWHPLVRLPPRSRNSQGNPSTYRAGAAAPQW